MSLKNAKNKVRLAFSEKQLVNLGNQISFIKIFGSLNCQLRISNRSLSCVILACTT